LTITPPECLSAIDEDLAARGLSRIPVYQEHAVGTAGEPEQMTRMHVPLSSNDDESQNISEAKAVINANMHTFETLFAASPGAVRYLFFAISCGSEHKFARTVELDLELLKAAGALGCRVVLNVFPHE
jgi:hypothetical protein